MTPYKLEHVRKNLRSTDRVSSGRFKDSYRFSTVLPNKVLDMPWNPSCKSITSITLEMGIFVANRQIGMI